MTGIKFHQEFFIIYILSRLGTESVFSGYIYVAIYSRDAHQSILWYHAPII